MRLLERESYLALLSDKFAKVADGEGHSIFLFGESGIGKSSLLAAFTKQLNKKCKVYHGTCDAMFSPRPLAPLYDIAWQIRKDLINDTSNIHDRSALFSAFYQELKEKQEACVIIFEDIHWADEATIDFIKFLARRIKQLPCLFLLTYRDNEIQDDHPLTNMFGQLPHDSLSRMEVRPLSREAVMRMAEEKNYDGDKVYSVSGGNPYYVAEILSSYSEGVPASIRDAIVSAYNRTGEKTRHVWDLLSIVPGKFETKYLQKFEPSFLDAIHNCMQLRILILDNDEIYFKHELFRRTIEQSLSPVKRISLNKTMLNLFMKDFEHHNEIERIVHHAKHANDHELVLKYAPIAAKYAASYGAHAEASKLLATAIASYEGHDADVKINLFKDYAYECYLTNNLEQAVLYARKTLHLLAGNGDAEKIAGCMIFLSHLLCCAGDWKEAVKIGNETVNLLACAPGSRAKALSYANMAQLKMHWGEMAEIMDWAEKAMSIAEDLHDEEVLCHSQIIIGAIRMNKPSSVNEGWQLLQKGLSVALKHSLHEHAARAYLNMAINGMRLKDYRFVKNILHEGLLYCEERELDFWKQSILSVKGKFLLETGKWDEAFAVAEDLFDTTYKGSFNLFGMVMVGQINMRRGSGDSLEILNKAKALAYERFDFHVIIAAVIALLEYEWLTGKFVIDRQELTEMIALIDKSMFYMDANEFAFWLMKARNQQVKPEAVYDAYQITNIATAQQAAAHWQKTGNPYMYAQSLFEGDEEDKKSAISIVQRLGAGSVYEKMKQEMRTSGIKGIPRGLRKATKLNPALLTGREMDVLQLLKHGLQNKEIASKLYISAKTVDHHISSILFKLDVNSRVKAVNEAIKLDLIK